MRVVCVCDIYYVHAPNKKWQTEMLCAVWWDQSGNLKIGFIVARGIVNAMRSSVSVPKNKQHIPARDTASRPERAEECTQP